MATVRIPPQLQKLTGGERIVEVPGSTLREVIDALEEAYPGFRAKITEGDTLRPGLCAAIDSVVSTRGLLQPVGHKSEVTFVPAISGG